MEEKKINKRIEEIINISKEKSLNPPVELILTTDGKYILKSLYDEYVNLLRKKEELKKPYKEEDKIKYEQLMYIKDKMNFIQERGKLSEDTISLSAKDVEEYSECQKLYNELHSELKPVLKYFDNTKEENKNKEEKEIKKEKEEIIKTEKVIEDTIQMPIINSSKIDVEEVKKEEVKSKEDEIEEKKDNIININNNNNKLLQDLADIDKLLGLVGYDSYNIQKEDDDIKIGDILVALDDVNSYNNEDLKATKDEKYKVISFVSLDENDKVINSSNLSNKTYEEFKKENDKFKCLFVISSLEENDKKIVGSFDNIEKFKKESTI